jgi:hypothetical protein
MDGMIFMYICIFEKKLIQILDNNFLYKILIDDNKEIEEESHELDNDDNEQSMNN